MNTKQLWTALTLNEVTNSYFDGVYSIDTLIYSKEKPQSFVIQKNQINQESIGFCFSLMKIQLIFMIP